MVKISIITPTLNSQNTIKYCIESVAKQSYKNIEHIILDGFSTDNTVSIVKTTQHLYHNVKLVVGKDEGIYDAMNKGIKIATGDYLLFLGSDDRLWNNNILENIFTDTKNLQYDFIYGNVNSPVLGEAYDGVFTVKKIFSINICHQSIFYKKELFEKLGCYNTKYKVAADHVYNIKCFLNKKIKKLFIPVTIAFYAPGGLSKIADKLFIRNRRLIIAKSAFPYYPLLGIRKYLSHFKHKFLSIFFK